ncbi:MAG: TonB-dependent receptor plug domain-containing protein, partial [Bacteroidota bacterium]
MKEVLLLFFTLLASTVFCQADTTLFQGEGLPKDIVITAQRREELATTAPPNVHYLNQAKLENRTARSLAEALIGTPGVWMQKTNHGGGSPFLRGMTGNQALLLLDGIRLNNSTYRFGPNQYFNTVDPFSLQRVEVVLGAGSVLYGSDALGGTVNLISNDPEFSPNGLRINPSFLLRARSSEMEYTARSDLSVSSKNLAFRAGFSWRDFGTLVGGGNLGELVATAYDERAFDTKVLVKTGNRSHLTLAYNGLVQTDVGRYDQVAQRGYEFYDFDPQERQMAYLRWENQPKSAWIEQLEWTTAWQYSREVRRRKREEATTIRTDEDRISTWSSSGVMNTRFSKNWTIVSGVEFYFDEITSTSNDFDLV